MTAKQKEFISLDFLKRLKAKDYKMSAWLLQIYLYLQNEFVIRQINGCCFKRHPHQRVFIVEFHTDQKL